MSDHGVMYSPSSIERPQWSVDNDTEFVRIYWCDFANTRRVRIVPIQYFRKILQSKRPGVNIAKVALGLVGLGAAPGFLPFGEYVYHLDETSLRRAHSRLTII